LIGLSGNTGSSTGPHLCFVINVGGTSVDPMSVLPPRVVANTHVRDTLRARFNTICDYCVQVHT